MDRYSDEKLLELCQKYGFQARLWKQKFLGLLPEVNRRRLYEKKGFGSIVEFAAKLAGVSKEQVKRVLSLAEHFEDKPVLKNLLEDGKVSVNKLARVVSIATVENQEILADQVRLLSQKALETLARDERRINFENQNGLLEPNFDHKFVHTHKSRQDHEMSDSVNSWMPGLSLSAEVQQKLLELQNKGIDINQLILESLEKRDMEIAQEKEKLAVGEKQKLEHQHDIWKTEHVKMPRYISVKIKNIINKEHGTKCSVPTCKKPAMEIHHSNRFSLSKIHDPRFMSPFCHEHHQIAHTIDQKYHEQRMGVVRAIS